MGYVASNPLCTVVTAESVHAPDALPFPRFPESLDLERSIDSVMQKLATSVRQIYRQQLWMHDKQAQDVSSPEATVVEERLLNETLANMQVKGLTVPGDLTTVEAKREFLENTFAAHGYLFTSGPTEPNSKELSVTLLKINPVAEICDANGVDVSPIGLSGEKNLKVPFYSIDENAPNSIFPYQKAKAEADGETRGGEIETVMFHGRPVSLTFPRVIDQIANDLRSSAIDVHDKAVRDELAHRLLSGALPQLPNATAAAANISIEHNRLDAAVRSYVELRNSRSVLVVAERIVASNDERNALASKLLSDALHEFRAGAPEAFAGVADGALETLSHIRNLKNVNVTVDGVTLPIGRAAVASMLSHLENQLRERVEILKHPAAE